jgi:hypothetical protein
MQDTPISQVCLIRPFQKQPTHIAMISEKKTKGGLQSGFWVK